MQQREKTLLIILLGAVGFWVVLPMLEGILLGPFQSRINRRDELTSQVETKTKQAETLATQEHELMLWSVDSLPPDPLNAQRVYSEWLVELARLSGWQRIEPQLGSRNPSAQVFTTIPVVLSAEATLREVATFLFHFERTGLMHRITKCDLSSPETEGDPRLKVTLVAEGIALRDAPQRSRIFPRTILKQPVDSDAGVIEVEPSTSFPPDEALRVRIGHEFLTATKRDGGRWSVTRGDDATTPEGHEAGALVEYAPLNRDLDSQRPQSVNEYERLLSNGPFAKPRPPFVYEPKLATIPSQTLMKGQPLSLQVKLSGWDPANGPAKYGLDDFSPASMQIDKEGRITWNPAVTTESGEYPVQVRVTSTTNDQIALSTEFNINLRDPNLPPQLPPPAELPTAWIGREWTATVQGSDAEQPDQLTYSLTGQLPEGMTIDARSGQIKWTVPNTTEPGVVSVTVQVADQGSPPLSATSVLNLNVQDDPRPFTYLSGSIGSPGQMTAYLYDRSNNKSWTLKVGDNFQIADIAGRVVEVDRRSMEIETTTGRLRVEMDVPLSEAKRIEDAPPTTPDAASRTLPEGARPAAIESSAAQPVDDSPAPAATASPATTATANEPANEPATDR
ncbi:MAG: cadherin repeat domain-containing protein [Planctomycetaceae bacterium]